MTAAVLALFVGAPLVLVGVVIDVWWEVRKYRAKYPRPRRENGRW